MTHWLAQVRFARSSGLPTDVVVNTFHFDFDPMTDELTQATSVASRLKAFYDTAPKTGISALRSYMSSVLSQNGHEIRIYDQAEPEPRTPIYTEKWNFSAALQSTNQVASEVALVLSFTAGGLSGSIAARRRGRIFLGPLAPSITVANGDVRPSSTMITALAEAGNTLRTSGAGTPWCVWSAIGQTLLPVTKVWVDDAFDTQRRRGAKPQTRTTIPA